nr:hypothetical protein [Tanacetum cinerariifolium]
MSSESHATVTYTSMSSYEVIVNGYYGMPMDPLDPYAQLVMEAPPSPKYIPGPEATPSPDYIPGTEAPPSPNYIPGPEYPEYLPPADDVLPAEEQPLPAAVSPTVESPGYITKSEPEMEPEEEDGDDKKSEEDYIEFPTSKGDNDADDDGDDLSEDDADDEDKEEYIGGLPDMIHSSVKASKPQSMQEAIEFATEMMDKKMLTHAKQRDADRSRNGDNSNDSGICRRRQMTTPRECSYTDFIKCQPMSFQGTEGVVGLT